MLTILLFYRTGLHLVVKMSTPASLCQNLIVRNVCGHIKLTHSNCLAMMELRMIWNRSEFHCSIYSVFTPVIYPNDERLSCVCLWQVYPQTAHLLSGLLNCISTIFLIRWKTFNMLIWYMYSILLFNYYFEYHSPYFAKIAQVKALWLSIYML